LQVANPQILVTKLGRLSPFNLFRPLMEKD
jgi:hypothetical protein